MKGDYYTLALTTKTVTHEDDPTLAEGETRVEPLFAFPIQVCSALDSTSDPRFDVAAPSGVKREQVYRDPTTGEIVADDACLRGTFVGDTFKPIPAESIAAIRETTSSKTMVVSGKVPRDEFLAEYAGRIKGRYYLQVPSKAGFAAAYRLTYESLVAERTPRGKVVTPPMVLTTKRTAKSRQKLCAIMADEERGCLVLVECAFASEVREPDDQVRAWQLATVNEDAIAKARKIVAAIPDGHVVMQTEVDDAVALKREALERAIDGESVSQPVRVGQVAEQDSLSAALEASLAALG